MKESLKKKEEDEINKDNILLQRKEEKKAKKPKKEKQGEKEGETEGEKEGEKKDRIKGLFEWDKERKKKIEDKQKENTEKIESGFDYVPKIDKRSNVLAEHNKFRQKEPNVFERLAKTDEMLKGKKQILIETYTPTFQPASYVPRNMNLDKLKKRNIAGFKEGEEDESGDDDEKKHKGKKKKNKESDEEDEEEDEEEEDEEEEDEDEENEGKDGGFDFKQNTMKFAEDDVQDALRISLFNKKKAIKK